MNATTEQKNSVDPSRLGWLVWVGLAASAMVLVAFRLHAFDVPLETDECNYAYTGGRLLAGDDLYTNVWDHQPPGVFVLFAGAITLFGDAPIVFRWLATAFSLVSLLLIFAILRRVEGTGTAILGAFLFALASSDPGTAGDGCNREIFMNALVLAAWFAVLRKPTLSWRALVTAGVLLALASSIKTIIAVHWFLLVGWIAFIAWRNAGTADRVRAAVASVAFFAAGPVLLWGATLAYFAATGRFDVFVDAVFLFNLSYSGGGEAFADRFTRFFAPDRHPFIFDSALPLWIGSIGASLWLTVECFLRRRWRRTVAILLLLFSGYLAACLPARFWPHYYGLLIPPLVLVVSLAVGRLARFLHERYNHQSGLLGRASLALYFVFPALLFTTEYDAYLRQPPFGITVKRYNSRDFWGRAHGENLRRVTDPGDEVFVYGNDTEIYYYAQRRCASRYTMITGLQTGHAGAQQRRETLLAELEERLPRVIIVLFDEPPFDGWLPFLDRHYGEAVGVDYHDRTGEAIMIVFARSDQPIESIDWNWDRSAVGGWALGEQPP